MSPILLGFLLAGIVSLLILVVLSCGRGTPTIERGAASIPIATPDHHPAGR